VIMLSIVMPVYNERTTIRSAIEGVLKVDYPCPVELVVIDDGSTDDTADILEELSGRGMRLIRHPRNLGKGAAVRSGVAVATGSHMIILDADLEYSPDDIPAMLRPVLLGRADHVFGTRVFGLNTRYRSFRFAMGGRALTLVANILYDSCLTDMHTCLKLLPVADFQALRLSENGFGLDTEISARLLRDGMRPFEVPVSYDGRSIEQGKKITWRDGVRCLSILIKVRVQRYPESLAIAERHRRAAPTVAHASAPTDGRPAEESRVLAPVLEIPPPALADRDDSVVAI
jgi:glycosyltransferase involved in cell wall biosynthesis